MVETAEGTDVETAPRFDRFWWMTLRVLQASLALFILAGLAGVFGGGWLATSTIHVGAFEVTYERFARKSVPFRIRVRATEPANSEELRVSVGRELVDHVGIVRTIPTAAASIGTSSGTEFVFKQTPDTMSDIAITMQPDRFGWFNWTLRIGQNEMSLFQIIYP